MTTVAGDLLDLAAVPASAELDRDLALAAELLAETFEEQGGVALRTEIERLHGLCQARRRLDATAAGELCRTVAALTAERADALVRACSMQLQLANLCEELERVRRGRRYDAEAGEAQPESIAEAAALLRRLPASERREALERLDCRLVLTMHPSDATRRAVLYKLRAVEHGLEELARAGTGGVRRRRLLDTIREALAIWWRTDEVRRLRPDVGEEVRRTLFVFESVLFDAAPDVVLELERRFGVELERPPLRFGSWAGADMDGNPAVGGATVIATARQQRELALGLLAQRVRRLTRVFTQSDSAIAASPELREALRRGEDVPGAEPYAARFTHEPLRLLLFIAWRRLELALAGEEGGYATPAELEADLELVSGAAGSGVVARGALRRLLWQARIFGFHLAALDVRLHAADVRLAATELLPGYGTAAGEEERVAALEALAPASPGAGEGRVRDVEAAFEAAHELDRRDPRAFGSLVLSGTERPSDVLCALRLSARHGLRPDVVPLFESGASLRAASRTMAALYGSPAYRAHLNARGRRQEIMVGYSDSAKDEGFAAAQWSLYGAQQALAVQAEAEGIELCLFHGRGGSTARGGGPIHAAILGGPPEAASGRLKVTEQGEVVTLKYSHPELGLRALEQTLSAVVRRTVRPAPDPPPRWREAMERLAATAAETYRALVYDDPRFPTFFRECTPIDMIAELPLGSRPASRGIATDVASLRAIPWSFAWTQNRSLLPSWYGAGSGLEAVPLPITQEMWHDWPFFQALVRTLEIALFKSDLRTAERYLRLAGDPAAAGALFGLLADEHERTVNRVLELTGQSVLLERRPVLTARLPMRNPWVDLLGDLQVELLARYRRGDETVRTPLLASVAGIAAGVRNTG